MLRCQTCGTEKKVGSQYCDECGTKLVLKALNGDESYEMPPLVSGSSGIRSTNITSVGIPPLVQPDVAEIGPQNQEGQETKGSHSRLIIERGTAVDTEFVLSAEESYIGRWDADNGIFPDVDLDTYDPDAKVSRRHARVILRNDIYMIEDLGSTNGTFINRGRRLLPGSPQVLNEGDEIIVGKTFLRFHINR